MSRMPFTSDRAIPLYVGLAEFLSTLDIPARRGRKNNNGPMHGAIRALLLQQLHHRLTDSPAAYMHRLVTIGKQTYFTASWGEWHRFELPFLTAVQIRLEFRNLIDAGYVKVARTADPAGRVSLKLNYELLRRDMEADERFRFLVDRFVDNSTPRSGDQPPDHVISPPDHVISPPDHVISPPDHVISPPDHVIRESQSIDQKTDHTIKSESSSPSPLLSPTVDETTSPDGGEGTGDETASPDPLDQRAADFEASLKLLSSQGIHKKVAEKLAAINSLTFIQSWINAKQISLLPKREGGLGARSWTGFLITVLEAQQQPPVIEQDIPEHEKFALDKYAYEYGGFDIEQINAIRRKHGLPIPAQYDTPDHREVS